MDDSGYIRIKTDDCKGLNSVCPECGGTIGDLRRGKRFCCESCRMRWNNRLTRLRRERVKWLTDTLDRNHAILEDLISSGVKSVDVNALTPLGFRSETVSSVRNVSRECEFGCYDIFYRIRGTKLTHLRKVSLPL